MNMQDKAFPNPHLTSETGMTMRDYFAAKAMSALIAASGDSDGIVDYVDDVVANCAYKMADAMLKAGK